ncbi:MAG TPA: T9SS type A sorting domain-containing protein [Bacteroidota bacterium]|nr:T9SS type A sorting domain-containing protein [Bacteroidota bacterium]
MIGSRNSGPALRGAILFSCCTIALTLLALSQSVRAQIIPPNWDNPSQWILLSDSGCSIQLSSDTTLTNGDGLVADYQLRPASGWAILRRTASFDVTRNPVTFLIKASSADNLELKFTDGDGSVFGRRISMQGMFLDWTRVTVYLNNTSYWWGGDSAFGTLATFELAVSGTGSGTVSFDEIGEGVEGLPSTLSLAGPVLDPDRELPGIGFRQRRAGWLNPEDTLVLSWLKVMQDNASVDRRLIPSMELDNVAQTFNNSIAAMAFILSHEQERAERILDFYAGATRPENTDLTLQNFFVEGQARGFYQQVSLSSYHDESGSSDRWIGDMAWLLCACKFYDQEYSSDRYAPLIGLIRDLFASFYKPQGPGGYIQSGWRDGDRYLHEATGHPEGNIDCYAALLMCGEASLAAEIRSWLESVIGGAVDLPLDLYSWRTLAFGEGSADLLNIPEYDLRYRKILNVRGNSVMGFYNAPDIEINNFWIDGTGHMACAYLAAGQAGRGFFYANQLDSLLIDRFLFGVHTRALPYTLNRSGGYGWVDSTKGFSSTCAWYILAKNGFNPLTISRSPMMVTPLGALPAGPRLYQNYPNPFNPSTVIRFDVPARAYVELKVSNLLGETVAILERGLQEAGRHEIAFDASRLASGLYFYSLRAGAFFETKKMLFIR